MNSLITNSPEQHSGRSSELSLPRAESLTARHGILDVAMLELEQAAALIEQRFGSQYTQQIPGLGERSIAAAATETDAVTNQALTVDSARQYVERAQMSQGEYA